MLGLDPQAVFSDVHALASTGPQAEATVPVPSGGFALDLRKVQAKLAETEQVSSLLEGIFREEAPVIVSAVVPLATAAPPGAESAGAPSLAGLDAAHSELLRRLARKIAWARLDVERTAADLGLLPDGALEVINEAAFERSGAPLLEGDEIIEIDQDVLQEIMEENRA